MRNGRACHEFVHGLAGVIARAVTEKLDDAAVARRDRDGNASLGFCDDCHSRRKVQLHGLSARIRRGADFDIRRNDIDPDTVEVREISGGQKVLARDFAHGTLVFRIPNFRGELDGQHLRRRF